MRKLSVFKHKQLNMMAFSWRKLDRIVDFGVIRDPHLVLSLQQTQQTLTRMIGFRDHESWHRAMAQS